MSNDDRKLKETLKKLIGDSLQIDKDLREQYHVGEKFRFIRDRLIALQARIEDELKSDPLEIEEKIKTMAEDENLVFVHVYNAQGIVFTTWQKFLNPSVFYEYSVNRPVYADKNQIQAFIRSRPNKVQHGFLTFVIKKSDILPLPQDQAISKDQMGNPLIRIREGSLKSERMLSFTHQNNEYEMKQGQIIPKTE